MPKTAYFEAKMAVFGPSIQIILGGSKSSGTHISENHLVRIVLLAGHGTKWIRKANIWPKMFKNAYFGPELAVFGPKSYFLERE